MEDVLNPLEKKEKTVKPMVYRKHHKNCKGFCRYCRQLKTKSNTKRKQTDYPWDEPSVLL